MLTDAAEFVPGRWQRLWLRVHRRATARRWLLWLVAGVAALVLLWPTIARLDFANLGRNLRSADPLWLAVALVANFLTLPLMTWQWQLLLPRERATTFGKVWPCVAIGMASMNVLPAAGGHAVATGLLASREITTVSGGVSLLALEQLCEAFAKLVLVAFVVATVSAPPALWRAAWLTLGVAALLTTVVLWIASRQRKTASGHSPWHAWAGHLQSLRSPLRFSTACALSVLMKVVAWVAIDAVQRSVGIHLAVGQSALVLAAVTFASMVSIAPGNVGFFELGAVASYQFAGVGAAQAAALALLVHVAFLIPIVGAGYLVILYRAVAAPRRK